MVAGAGLLGMAASEDVRSQSAPAARGNGKPRALALIGDRYHNPDYIRVSLDKVFKDLDVPIDYTIQYDSISASLLKNYQLLVILRDGMIWPDGYLGPDAYTAYEADLETPKTFPDPKPVITARLWAEPTSVTLLFVLTRCTPQRTTIPSQKG